MLSTTFLIEAVLLGVFVWHAWSNKWLSDDGYIYLTYVQNLTENGWGPVFNRGERVEGFTSPMWYAILSLANLVRPDALLDARQLVLLLSLVMSTVGVGVWVKIERAAAACLADSAGATPHRRGIALNLPLAFLVAWYPLHSFATSGLETPLQLLVLGMVVLYVWTDTPQPVYTGLLAGVLPLVRPELGLISVMLVGWHWTQRRERRDIWYPVSLFVGITALTTVIRVAVYGQLLPNTYYAKTATGHGFGSGWEYIRDTTVAYGLHWVLAAAIVVVILPVVNHFGATRRLMPADRATRPRAWFLSAAVVQTVYVAAVGGDFMHARFLLTAVLMLLAVFAGIGSTYVRQTGLGPRSSAAVAVGVSLLIFGANVYTTPVQRLLSEDEPVRVGDVSDEQLAYLYRNPSLNSFTMSSEDPWTQLGRAAREMSEKLDMEIGVTRGGIGNFAFAAQTNGGRVYVYDVLGLTRPDVAHIDMTGQPGRVGHAKRAPDVLVAANDRVDFHYAYFEGWVDHTRIEVSGQPFAIFNPDLIDPLVEHGLMPAEQAVGFRAWLLDVLAQPQVDRNLVTFLTMRYHREDEVLARVRKLAHLDESSAWRQWLDATEEARSLLDARGCHGSSAWACVANAFRRHESSTIPELPNGPDWAAVGS